MPFSEVPSGPQSLKSLFSTLWTVFLTLGTPSWSEC